MRAGFAIHIPITLPGIIDVVNEDGKDIVLGGEVIVSVHQPLVLGGSTGMTAAVVCGSAEASDDDGFVRRHTAHFFKEGTEDDLWIIPGRIEGSSNGAKAEIEGTEADDIHQIVARVVRLEGVVGPAIGSEDPADSGRGDVVLGEYLLDTFKSELVVVGVVAKGHPGEVHFGEGGDESPLAVGSPGCKMGSPVVDVGIVLTIGDLGSGGLAEITGGEIDECGIAVAPEGIELSGEEDDVGVFEISRESDDGRLLTGPIVKSYHLAVDGGLIDEALYMSSQKYGCYI